MPIRFSHRVLSEKCLSFQKSINRSRVTPIIGSAIDSRRGTQRAALCPNLNGHLAGHTNPCRMAQTQSRPIGSDLCLLGPSFYSFGGGNLIQGDPNGRQRHRSPAVPVSRTNFRKRRNRPQCIQTLASDNRKIPFSKTSERTQPASRRLERHLHANTPKEVPPATMLLRSSQSLGKPLGQHQEGTL